MMPGLHVSDGRHLRLIGRMAGPINPQPLSRRRNAVSRSLTRAFDAFTLECESLTRACE